MCQCRPCLGSVCHCKGLKASLYLVCNVSDITAQWETFEGENFCGMLKPIILGGYGMPSFMEKTFTSGSKTEICECFHP